MLITPYSSLVMVLMHNLFVVLPDVALLLAQVIAGACRPQLCLLTSSYTPEIKHFVMEQGVPDSRMVGPKFVTCK